MNFTLKEAAEILERTPQSLEALLTGLSEGWLHSREGEGTWSPVEVIDHLIEAETTNWIVRLAFIFQEGNRLPFPPFDRYAHLQAKSESTLKQKLDAFKTLRLQNIAKLKELVQSDEDLERTGNHTDLGIVKARELISTWVVHDLTHTAQIVRILAERYRSDVGPWIEYLSILNKRQ